MLFKRDHTTDGIFLSLKNIATRGGERGPLYDEGVLSVINQIEATGTFVPVKIQPFAALIKNPYRLFSSEEIKELEAELQRRGWTPEQGTEYMGGVQTAQDLLKGYASPES